MFGKAERETEEVLEWRRDSKDEEKRAHSNPLIFGAPSPFPLIRLHPTSLANLSHTAWSKEQALWCAKNIFSHMDRRITPPDQNRRAWRVE